MNKTTGSIKKSILLFVTGIAISVAGSSQENKPVFTPDIKIYSNFRYQTGESGKISRFELNRAYLGFYVKHADNLVGRVRIEGRQVPLHQGSTDRYFFLRNAYLEYTTGNMAMTFGLTEGRGHKEPYANWDKRYLSKPFLARNKFLNVADVGLIIDYKISPIVKVSGMILNGEGHTNPEVDNHLLYGATLTFKPREELTFMVYTDFYSRIDSVKKTYSMFAGYINSRFRLGAEYNYKSSYDWNNGHNMHGWSIYSGYNITNELELFFRVDNLSEALFFSEAEQWKSDLAGYFIVSGIQYCPLEILRISLNYQGCFPSDKSGIRINIYQVSSYFRF